MFHDLEKYKTKDDRFHQIIVPKKEFFGFNLEATVYESNLKSQDKT